jgi:hypothetical protein
VVRVVEVCSILARMNLVFEVIGQAALLFALAQSPQSNASLKAVKLEPPIYPPIAMAARISGEVDLKITLRGNGVPETVQVEGGPQILRQAAVESAKRSKFESVAGGHAEESYRLVYKFVLDNTRGCNEERDKSYPRLNYDSNKITISEQPIPLCDPAADVERTRVRSAKCLFLWRCGLRLTSPFVLLRRRTGLATARLRTNVVRAGPSTSPSLRSGFAQDDILEESCGSHPFALRKDGAPVFLQLGRNCRSLGFARDDKL